MSLQRQHIITCTRSQSQSQSQHQPQISPPSSGLLPALASFISALIPPHPPPPACALFFLHQNSVEFRSGGN